MSDATYSFLPWARQGAGNLITQADSDPGVHVRVTVPFELRLEGSLRGGSPEPRLVSKAIPLHSAADVVGIDSRAIIRVEPPPEVTNFEPNLLPFVEFYDEDFPWRYTPAAPDTAKQRLRPWIALIVLEEAEFTEAKNVQGQPLPHIELTPGAVATEILPIPEQLWAWAHVQVDQDVAPDQEATAERAQAGLRAIVAENPDLARARLVSPRRLEPNVRYHAFVVPTFEAGRLACLGREIPDNLMATTAAWGAGQVQLPYYHRWSFKTGTLGDFEYLVKLLKPAVVGATVGNRPIDVLHPGSDLPRIDTPAHLNGVLKLGGLLQVPEEALTQEEQDEARRFDNWDEPYPHEFQRALAERINLAADYQQLGVPEDGTLDEHPDPIVVSPLYGRWHAMVDRVLDEADSEVPPNWVHEANLDPRFRIAAGLGTRVVQKHQEEYMRAAWEQIGEVLEANRRLRLWQLAQLVNVRFFERTLAAVEPGRLFLLTAPLHPRILSGGLTLHAHTLQSPIPQAMLSSAFRRAVRPSAPVVRRLQSAFALSDHSLPRVFDLVAAVNDGHLKPAPDKAAPPNAHSLQAARENLKPAGPGWFVDLLANHPWLEYLFQLLTLLLLVLAIVAPLVGLSPLLFGLVALVSFFVQRYASQVVERLNVVATVDETRETQELIDRLPQVSSFELSLPSNPFQPVVGSQDNEVAARFKLALADAYRLTAPAPPPPKKVPLALTEIAERTREVLQPRAVIGRQIRAQLQIPLRLRAEQTQSLVPVMAHPVIDTPMYKPLSELGTELFLPNIDKIPRDSLTMLEPNQRFIEAYMLGLNHEMGRELLWRGYPTDQRGSVFRQCWDVNSLLRPDITKAERDQLYDVKRLHRWPLAEALGRNHPNPAIADTRLVLVVRGELLKRYPGTVIYAQRAQWQTGPSGTPDPSLERELVELSAAEKLNPPPTKLRRPLFEAAVAPDIYFVGFDLSPADARGGTTADADPGWFFNFEERAGETRLGADEDHGEPPPRLVNWNNTSWGHIGTSPGHCIALDRTLEFDAYQPSDQENRPIPADQNARYSPDTNAAELAYILYQMPVLVAVHASRLLPPRD